MFHNYQVIKLLNINIYQIVEGFGSGFIVLMLWYELDILESVARIVFPVKTQ